MQESSFCSWIQKLVRLSSPLYTNHRQKKMFFTVNLPIFTIPIDSLIGPKGKLGNDSTCLIGLSMINSRFDKNVKYKKKFF
jgi:hypothetical protein